MAHPIRMACVAAAALLALGAQADYSKNPPPITPISKEAYQAQMKGLEGEYDNVQARCRVKQGNDKEVCLEKARASRDIAEAELQMRYQPTPENDEKLRLTRAEAAYAVERQRCEDMGGAALKACRREAASVLAQMKAEARLQAAASADAIRSENASREKTALDDRHRETLYVQARERCAQLGADAREDCVINVRKRFGKL